MNESAEGEPTTGFELVPFRRQPVVEAKVLGEAPKSAIAKSRRVLVTHVATDFRVEEVNPLGEANRLIVAITVTFWAPEWKTERLFRRYYVYEVTDFTPERLQSTLCDIASDIGIAAGELRSGAPCTFEGKGQPLRPARRPGRPSRQT